MQLRALFDPVVPGPSRLRVTESFLNAPQGCQSSQEPRKGAGGPSGDKIYLLRTQVLATEASVPSQYDTSCPQANIDLC